MGAFDKYSNFNTECNFIGVQFGERQPVLEVELNELQDIQNEARADIIRESIPSGFSTISPLNYDYMAVNENTLAFKEESVAYVNGYRIRIPKGTVVDLGKAPEGAPREDLVFLEVWKEAVDQTDTINKEGGEGQPTVPNHIKDSRYPTAMSQRVQLKWRIRVQHNIDFDKCPQGFPPHYTYGYDNRANIHYAIPQGGLSNPIDVNTIGYIHHFSATTDPSRVNNSLLPNPSSGKDSGLFYCGRVNDPTSPRLFNIMDGGIYAIPMFRLFRKPSSGKARPIDYQKLHPEVNPFAFSERVKGEKVEKAEEINIKGKTLQNICGKPYIQATGGVINNNTIVIDTTSNSIDGGILIEGSSLVKPNSKYTFVYEVISNEQYLGLLSIDGAEPYYCFSIQSLPTTIGIHKIVLTSRDTWINEKFKIATTSLQGKGKLVLSDKFMLLEGDHTNKEIPKEHFSGIRSIGEANEPITLKSRGKNLLDLNQIILNFTSPSVSEKTNNGIRIYNTTPLAYAQCYFELTGLKPNTKYVFKANQVNTKQGVSLISSRDINDKLIGVDGISSSIFTAPSNGKVRLKLYSTSANAIVGDIEYADLQLEEGDVTTTYETHKESKKTFCLKEPLRSLPNGVCDEIVGNKIIRRVGKMIFSGGEAWSSSMDDTDYFRISMKITPLISPSIMSSDIFCRPASMSHGAYEYLLMSGGYAYINYPKSKLTSPYLQGALKYLGEHPITVYYELDIPKEEPLEESLINDFNLERQFRETFSARDTLRQLPNGVKDTIENGKVIRRVKKLVLNGSEDWGIRQGEFTTPNHIQFTIFFSNKVQSNVASSIRCDKFVCKNNEASILTDDSKWCIAVNNGIYISFPKTELSTQDVAGFKAWLKTNPVTVYYELATPEEIPLEVIDYRYNTKKPLLELPNGVKDEIVGNKVIRNCGKRTFRGIDENWLLMTALETPNTQYFILSLNIKPTGGSAPYPVNSICDKLEWVNRIWDVANDTQGFGVSNDKSELYFRVQKSLLPSQTIQGFKTWLQNNPVTVVYPLATPYEEYITPDNCNYYPVTEGHNEYCGDLYYQEGINYTEVETIIEPEIVEVNTFRRVLPKGKAEIVGCNSKKHPEGYETIEWGQGKNLFNESLLENGEFVTFNGKRCFRYIDSAKFFMYQGHFKPNTSYALQLTAYREDVDVSKAFNIRFVYTDGTRTDKALTSGNKLTLVSDKSKVISHIQGSFNFSSYVYIDLDTCQLEEGEVNTPYEPFIRGEKTIPVIDENHVEDLRHKTSLTGFDYEALLDKNFDLFLRGEL